MFNKKLVIGVLVGLTLISALGYVLLNTDKEHNEPEQVVEVQKVEPSLPDYVKKTEPKPISIRYKKANLYNSTDKNMPFSSIADLSVLPESVRNTINEYLNESSGGIYFLKHNSNKALLVVGLSPEGEENPIKRHDFNFVEISMQDGKVLNNVVADKDSKYDKWNYDGDLPLSHTHYNDDNELIYTEIWNYSDEEAVKYKKTDKDGKVISLRKEVVDNNTNLREEHLFYDAEGNMTQNVSFNYDGIDLTRFTYYNSQAPEDSAMLVSEFEDGVKKKETLYSTDYKVKNIYLPEYKEGQKLELKIIDKDNNPVEILVEQ